MWLHFNNIEPDDILCEHQPLKCTHHFSLDVLFLIPVYQPIQRYGITRGALLKWCDCITTFFIIIHPSPSVQYNRCTNMWIQDTHTHKENAVYYCIVNWPFESFIIWWSRKTLSFPSNNYRSYNGIHPETTIGVFYLLCTIYSAKILLIMFKFASCKQSNVT